MKATRHTTTRILAGSIAALVGVQSAHATSDTWTGSGNALWSNSVNWFTNPGTVPGTTDIATFNNAGNANTTIDLSGVTIGSVVFDTAAAAAYTLGSGGVNNQTLTLDPSGAVTVNALVAANELFNAALVLGTGNTADAFTFTNNSASSLTFAGGISSGIHTGVKTLTVTGTSVERPVPGE